MLRPARPFLHSFEHDIGGGWFVYRYFAKPVYLTVAVGSADGEAKSLVSAIARRLMASNTQTPAPPRRRRKCLRRDVRLTNHHRLFLVQLYRRVLTYYPAR
jgi:hypothetical protein